MDFETASPSGRPSCRVGTVALWGSWISDGDEIRSSNAYPSSIYVPTIDTTGRAASTTEIVHEVKRYGCPVATVDPDEGNEVAAALRAFLEDPADGLWNVRSMLL